MEAFSDGVLAIIITIMVLEFEVPHGTSLAELQPLVPKFLSYVLSFIYIGIYWNNHHHLLQTARHVSGRVLWANLHLLFWLSLIPFATAWMGENHLATWPVALYGAVLLGAAIAYTILTRSLIAHHGKSSELAAAIGSDSKGWFSIACYFVAILLAFAIPLLSCALYVVVAALWLVPDTRIEKRVAAQCQKIEAQNESLDQ
jgi:uncharacterized membrane protein